MIRPMDFDDIYYAAEMLASCSQTPWSANSLLTYFMREDARLYVASEPGMKEPEDERSIYGFFGVICMKPECEVLDLTVDGTMRRKGIASALMNEGLSALREEGFDTVFLEVRESNDPARKLYRKEGFEEISVRKSYYTDPSEDAVIMKKTL